MQASLSARRAFTLVEVLVVAAVMALLAAILMPVFARAKAQAKVSQSLAQIRQIGLAIGLYAEGHDDRYPYATTTASALAFARGEEDQSYCAEMNTTATLDTALRPWVTDLRLYVSPFDRPRASDPVVGPDWPASVSRQKVSYSVECSLARASAAFSALPSPSETVILDEGFATPDWSDPHGKITCMTADFRVVRGSRAFCYKDQDDLF